MRSTPISGLFATLVQRRMVRQNDLEHLYADTWTPILTSHADVRSPFSVSLAGLAIVWYNTNMSTISVQDLERDLSTFLQRLQAGESFLVLKGGQPLAEIRPISTPTTTFRPFGLCAGQFRVPVDFDQPLPDDLLQEFEGV